MSFRKLDFAAILLVLLAATGMCAYLALLWGGWR